MSPKSFEAVWLTFCRDESRQEFCFPPRNIVEIPVKIALLFWPPRILSRFAEASRRDFGRRELASRQESRRDSRQDPSEILAAEIFASRQESQRDSRQDRGEILAAGNFASRRESCRDPAGIPAEKKKSRRPKSRRDPGRIPVEIAAGSCQDPGPYFTRDTMYNITNGANVLKQPTKQCSVGEWHW